MLCSILNVHWNWEFGIGDQECRTDEQARLTGRAGNIKLRNSSFPSSFLIPCSSFVIRLEPHEELAMPTGGRHLSRNRMLNSQFVNANSY